MSKYDKLKQDNYAQQEIEQQLNFASQGMEEIVDDVFSAAEVYDNAEIVLNDIDEKFKKATGLDGVDILFLFFATGLQMVRQYLITNKSDRLTDQQAAKKTKGHNEEHSNRKRGEWFLPSSLEIIANPVPFDAQRQTKILKKAEVLKGSGDFGHRLVLGHDPILGWVFGTANIATSTLTTWRGDSFHVKSQAFRVGSVAKIDYLSSQVSTWDMLNVAFDRFFKNGIEGLEVLATSLYKEWVHLKSDIDTKKSLPLPILPALSPEITNSLAKYGLDMGNIKAFASQVFWAEAINVIIAILHGMYCYLCTKKHTVNENICKEEFDEILRLSEVKTRKILRLYNLIDSSSNLIVVS